MLFCTSVHNTWQSRHKIGPECILNPEVMGKNGIGILSQSYANMADDISLLKSDDYHVPDLELNSWLKPLWSTCNNPVISRKLQQLVSCGCAKECKKPCTCRGHCYGRPHVLWDYIWLLDNFLCSIVYVLILNYNAVHFYDFEYIFIDHHMSDRNIVMLWMCSWHCTCSVWVTV